MFNVKIVAIIAALLASFPMAHADPLNYWGAAISGTTNNLNAVVYTNNLFVAVGNAGIILTSPDGVNWSSQTSGTANSLSGVAYGNGHFVTVGANDTVLTSADATNWTAHPTGTNVNWNSVCFGNGKFAVLGRSPQDQNIVCVSSDAVTWTQSYMSWIYGTFPDYTILNGIVYASGHFAAMGSGEGGDLQSSYQDAEVLTSPDATNWNVTLGGGGLSTVSGLGAANGQLAVSLYNGGTYTYLYTSTDGTNWVQTTENSELYATCGGVDSHSSNILAGISDFTAITGNSQIGWTSHSVPETAQSSIVYGQNQTGTGVFVAVGSSNIIYCTVYTGAIMWTNTAGGNWSNPMNWSPNEVPGRLNAGGSPDDVQITAPGTYTVVLDEGDLTHYWDIRSLTLGGASGTQTLAMTNKILYANPMLVTGGGVLDDNGSSFHAVITVQNGGQINSINGTYYVAPLTIGNGGQMTAGGGGSFVTFHGNVVVENSGVLIPPAPFGAEIANDGSLTVAAGGLVSIPVGRLFLYGPMTNSGTVNLTGGSSSTDIRIDNNGTAANQGFLINLPGGTINLNGNGGTIAADYGNGDFINQGAVISSAASHTITVSDFENRGVVTNLYGTLSLSTFSNTLAGIFYATNGTTIQFSGGTAAAPLKPGVPLLLSGGGQFQFTSGWLDLTNDIIPNLQMLGSIYNNSFLELEPTFQGGAITNLALQGITLTNAPGTTWVVSNGVFAVTNSTVYGNFIVENGGKMITYFLNPFPTFYGDIHVENGSALSANGAWFYGNVIVDSGAEFDNLGAGTTLQAGGSMTINPGGALNSGYYFYLNAPMTNFGTINITNFGYPNDGYNFQVENDGSRYFGSLLNGPGGQINFSPGAGATPGIFHNGGYAHEYFINQGTLVSSVNAGIDVANFQNSGTISNLSGTLTLGVFRTPLSGSFYTTNGATTELYGGTAAAPLTPGALTLAGGGQYQFIGYNGYGWLDLSADIIPNLDLRGGVLELEPTFQGGAITNLTLDGITFTNANALLVTGNFNTTNSLVAGAVVVTNRGVWNASADDIYGPVTIESGGVLNDNSTLQVHPPGSMDIANGGQMNLAGGYLYLFAPLTNSGTVNLPNNNQIYIYNNGTTDQGGLLNQSGGSIRLFSSGGISGSEGHDYVINNGSIVKSSSSGNVYIRMTGFTNYGAIASQEGTLNLNNVSLQSSGSLNSQLNSKTDYGKISISGNVVLNGAIGATLNGTYVPAVGDSFTPLTYGSYTGTFTATNLPALVAWQTTYGAGALTLLVTQTGLIPEFTTVVSSGGNFIFNGTNGAPGNKFLVLTSTNLTAPLAQWTPVFTNNIDNFGRFSFTNTPNPAESRRFFILELP